MKLFRRIAVFLLTVVVAGSVPFVFACRGGGRTEGTIWIMYFKGGFGSEWLENATERYKALHPEVSFKLQQDPSLRSTGPLLMQSEVANNIPDLIITQYFNWNESVENGYLEPLDEIYNKPVAVREGQNVLLKDFIADDYQTYPWTLPVPGARDVHPWIIPWSANTTSLAYNEDLLKKTPRRAGGEWSAPPETEAELKELVGDINAASGTSAYSGKTVAPFIWPGASMHWLLFLQTTWWAQYQGLGDNNPANQGSWYDFWDFESPDVFLQDGLRESYRLLQDLFVKNPGQQGVWTNVPDGNISFSEQTAETEFMKGNAVMMPVGSWLENEMKDFLNDTNAYPNIQDHLRMMVLPSITGARSEKINNAQVGDFMCVPSKGLNKGLAKDFLLFLCQEEELVEFTKATGMMRPFKYNPIESTPDDYEWTVFQRDTISLYIDHENFYEHSRKESPFYVFKKLSPYYPTMATVVGNIRTMTPDKVVEEPYKNAERNWSTWLYDYGLSQ